MMGQRKEQGKVLPQKKTKTKKSADHTGARKRRANKASKSGRICVQKMHNALAGNL